MKTIKYRIKRYDTKIEAVEIERETEHVVFFKAKHWNGRNARANKVSDYEEYHDTWEQAHASLLKRVIGRLNSARVTLQDAQGEFGNVKGMKKP